MKYTINYLLKFLKKISNLFDIMKLKIVSRDKSHLYDLRVSSLAIRSSP